MIPPMAQDGFQHGADAALAVGARHMDDRHPPLGAQRVHQIPHVPHPPLAAQGIGAVDGVNHLLRGHGIRFLPYMIGMAQGSFR